MKYFVIELSEGDSTITKKSIYEYSDKLSAQGAFHSKLGTAMKSELYNSDLVILVDNTGTIYQTEYFVRPIEIEEG